jgi:hypothetical protein
MTFWDVVWFIFIAYLFIAYLMALFAVLSDLFRDEDTGGFVKAIWVLALIVLPVVTLLVYLIAKGSGMADRSARYASAARAQQETYIREVASASGTTTANGTSAVDQVAQAKALLDAEAISPAEFESLKAKALA